jgi:hypothetical protein
MQKKTLSAENTYTETKEVYGNCDISIAGTFEGTLTLQRSFDEGSTWKDVDTFTAPEETYFYEPRPNVLFRVGFKTGEYTSGSAIIILH